MTLLPSASGTVNAPPLITVPTAAVVMFGTWQMPQPIALNRFDPATASPVPASTVFRGGALVERMKLANTSMSFVVSSGSGVWSNTARDRPSDEFSVGWKRLVMPISFRYASAENESRLAC